MYPETVRSCEEELLRREYKTGSFLNYVGINILNYVGAGADSGTKRTGLNRNHFRRIVFVTIRTP